jgi:hypothetical protein
MGAVQGKDIYEIIKAELRVIDEPSKILSRKAYCNTVPHL